jgi:hypothetical protein
MRFHSKGRLIVEVVRIVYYKLSSLLRCGITYGHKMFYNTGRNSVMRIRCPNYKTFFTNTDTVTKKARAFVHVKFSIHTFVQLGFSLE